MKYWGISKSSFIAHHGIKGQKWGIQNGPPYPLDRNKDGSISKEQKEKKSDNIENDSKKRTSRDVDVSGSYDYDIIEKLGFGGAEDDFAVAVARYNRKIFDKKVSDKDKEMLGDEVPYASNIKEAKADLKRWEDGLSYQKKLYKESQNLSDTLVHLRNINTCMGFLDQSRQVLDFYERNPDITFISNPNTHEDAEWDWDKLSEISMRHAKRMGWVK